MRKNSSKQFLMYLLGFLVLSVPACYEAVEGCLDVAAKNFTVDADFDCPDDCCTYPSLKLILNHRVGGPDNSDPIKYLDSIYTDAQRQVFRLQMMQYYLSNFNLVRTDGTLIPIVDQLAVQSYDDAGNLSDNTLTDDFLLINPSFSRSLTVGEIRESGTIEAVQFKLGLEELANRTDTSSVEEDHPLGSIDEPMFIDPAEGYTFIKTAILRDTLSTDTIPTIVSVSGAANLIEYSFPFGQQFELDPGFNITLTLHIDYATWLNAIDDIKNDTAEEIATKIVSGMSQAFTLLEISVDNQ